jgi:hypothetical protein
VIDVAVSHIAGFLLRDTCGFQLCWIRLLGANRAYLHTGNYDLQEVSYPRFTQFSQGNNVFVLHQGTQKIFNREKHLCITLTKQAYLEPNEHLFTMKIQIWSMYSYQKRTQFSTGNNVLGAPAPNTDGLFADRNVFLGLSWIGLFGTKGAPVHLENYELKDRFLSKTNSITTGKQCGRCHSL